MPFIMHCVNFLNKKVKFKQSIYWVFKFIVYVNDGLCSGSDAVG